MHVQEKGTSNLFKQRMAEAGRELDMMKEKQQAAQVLSIFIQCLVIKVLSSICLLCT